MDVPQARQLFIIYVQATPHFTHKHCSRTPYSFTQERISYKHWGSKASIDNHNFPSNYKRDAFYSCCCVCVCVCLKGNEGHWKCSFRTESSEVTWAGNLFCVHCTLYERWTNSQSQRLMNVLRETFPRESFKSDFQLWPSWIYWLDTPRLKFVKTLWGIVLKCRLTLIYNDFHKSMSICLFKYKRILLWIRKTFC